jgi:hypothetical protein
VISTISSASDFYNSPMFFTQTANISLQVHSITMGSFDERTKTEYNKQRSNDKSDQKVTDEDLGNYKFERTKLPYQRDMKQSAKIRDSFIQSLHAITTPDQVGGVRGLMKETDIVDVYASMINNAGLDATRMEDVLAFWYGHMWMVSNKSRAPTPKQYRGISLQIFQSINQSDTWKKMSDRQKQELVETLIYPAFMQYARHLGYQKTGDAAGLDSMARAARTGLNNSSLKIQGMRLTDARFVK